LVTVCDAIEFINRYDEANPVDGFVRYEVDVRYRNGDQISGRFEERNSAVSFLRGVV